MNLAESTFYLHLTDAESLRLVISEGLDDVVLPTKDLLPVWHFAHDYFINGGMTKAPSAAVLIAEYGDTLNDFEVDLEQDPEETIDWALEHLKGSWVYSQVVDFQKALAGDMAEAETLDRIRVLGEKASELLALSHAVQSASVRVDVREGAVGRLVAYEAREQNRGAYHGASAGMAAVDEYTNGIHPGELAIAAAGPKVGKSMWLAYMALKNWEAGRSPVLVTLENSVDMTIDRIACMATSIDPRRWQRGVCHPEEVDRVRAWIERLSESDVPLHVIQPDLGQRNFETLVAEAKVRDADVLFIDQLTFVELGGDSRRPKHERIGDALHRLKGMISTGRHRIPCWLAHQINREGVKAAEKLGYLEMYHLAESAEVERTADWVFGLYASNDDRGARRAKLQTLAARREVERNWELDWHIDTGLINVRRELSHLKS